MTGIVLYYRKIYILVMWSNNNKLLFNVKKCEKITYTRKTLNVISHSYNIRGEALREAEQVTDLGILMDRRMEFRKHICVQMRKARRMLGFIVRTSHHFREMEGKMPQQKRRSKVARSKNAAAKLRAAKTQQILEIILIQWHVMVILFDKKMHNCCIIYC